MPNFRQIAWVKNVYNLRMNGSKNSASLSTKSYISSLKHDGLVNKSQSIHQKINRFTTNLFTTKTAILPLFEYKFYPVSTAPIIKTNKERN